MPIGWLAQTVMVLSSGSEDLGHMEVVIAGPAEEIVEEHRVQGLNLHPLEGARASFPKRMYET